MRIRIFFHLYYRNPISYSFCFILFDFIFIKRRSKRIRFRISKSGYIEVPSPLIDNLVSGDDVGSVNGHRWWCFFNDAEKKLTLRPRRHIVHKTIDIPELNKLYPFFRSSFVIELHWTDSINVELGNEKYSYENKDYDLSVDRLQPFVMGESILMRNK